MEQLTATEIKDMLAEGENLNVEFKECGKAFPKEAWPTYEINTEFKNFKDYFKEKSNSGTENEIHGTENEIYGTENMVCVSESRVNGIEIENISSDSAKLRHTNLSDVQLEIVKLIETNPFYTLTEMAEQLNITKRALRYQMEIMKSGSIFVYHEGPTKKGKWVIQFKNNEDNNTK